MKKFSTKRAQYSIVLLLSLLTMNTVKSQVTIGADSEPVTGALLDLKEQVASAGEANSTKGLIIPRVELTDNKMLYPMLLNGYATTLDATHTGLVVYNTSTTTHFQKGLYLWSGAQWNLLRSVNLAAQNGLTVATTDTVELGGTLNKATTIAMNNYNLNFDRTSGGNVGINTASPLTALHITDQAKDPLIIDSLRFVGDSYNTDVDTSNSQYYDMRVSSGGVVRKVKPATVTPVYNLNADVTIGTGNATGSTGNNLTWYKDGVVYPSITLPEDGVYIFTLRLYGETSNTSQGWSYYVTAFKNSVTSANLLDAQEIAIVGGGTHKKATYNINLAVAGKAGDGIIIRIGSVSGDTVTWTLSSRPISDIQANRTSLVYWKL